MGDILGDLLAAILGDRWLRRRSARRAASGEFDCALRAEAKASACPPPRVVQSRCTGSSQRVVERQGARVGASAHARRFYRIATPEGALDWAVVAPEPEEAVRLFCPSA